MGFDGIYPLVMINMLTGMMIFGVARISETPEIKRGILKTTGVFFFLGGGCKVNKGKGFFLALESLKS